MTSTKTRPTSRGCRRRLFANAEYDEDDEEADRIYAEIDAHGLAPTGPEEARLKEELEKYRRDNPKITEQFAT